MMLLHPAVPDGDSGRARIPQTAPTFRNNDLFPRLITRVRGTAAIQAAASARELGTAGIQAAASARELGTAAVQAAASARELAARERWDD